MWTFTSHAHAACSGKLKVFYTEPGTCFPHHRQITLKVVAPPAQAVTATA